MLGNNDFDTLLGGSGGDFLNGGNDGADCDGEIGNDEEVNCGPPPPPPFELPTSLNCTGDASSFTCDAVTGQSYPDLPCTFGAFGGSPLSASGTCTVSNIVFNCTATIVGTQNTVACIAPV